MKDNTMLIVFVLLLGIGGALFLANQNNNATDTAPTPSTTNEQMMEEPQVVNEPTNENMMNKTVVEIAVEDENFSTLVAALTAADLVETLSGEGPFTVFAPTNEAFDNLPEGTLEALLADIPQLTSILTYHVVPGKVMAADVVNLTSATTVQGSDVVISVVEGKVMVNDAMVTVTDIEGSNGVIHVIDTVLIPQ